MQRFKEQNEELAGELSHKEAQLSDMRELLEEKGQKINNLQAIVEEHSRVVDARKQTVNLMEKQLEDQMKEAELDKLKAVTELVNKMQLVETQVCTLVNIC